MQVDAREFVERMALPVWQAASVVRWLEGRVENVPKRDESTAEKSALTWADCVSQEILLSALRDFFPGVEIEAESGQTILEAAEAAGIWIPRLCHMPGLEPFGGCRVCTVTVAGRPAAACVQPVANGMVVQNETEEQEDLRRRGREP